MADDADSLSPDRIKPGDPEIRVHAPRGALGVYALLPWGERVALDYAEAGGVWLGRFLAPRGLPDGLYKARIFVVGQSGPRLRGTLYFQIDSAPPAMALSIETLAGQAFDSALRIVATPEDRAYAGYDAETGAPVALGPDDEIVRDPVDGEGGPTDLRRLSVHLIDDAGEDLEIPLVRDPAHRERWEGYLPAGLAPGRHTARLLAVDAALNSTVTELTFRIDETGNVEGAK